MKRKAGAVFLAVFFLAVVAGAGSALGQQANFFSEAVVKVTFDDSPAVDEWPAIVSFMSTPSGVDMDIAGPEGIGTFLAHLLPSAWEARWDCGQRIFSLALTGGGELIDFPSPSTLLTSWSVDLVFSFDQAGDPCPTSVAGELSLEFNYSGNSGVGKVVVNFSPPFENCFFEGEECPPEKILANFQIWPDTVYAMGRYFLPPFVWAGILPSDGFSPGEEINLSTLRVFSGSREACKVAWNKEDGSVEIFIPKVYQLGLVLGGNQVCFTAQTFGGMDVEGCDTVNVKKTRATRR